MRAKHIVVVGASAGGIETLRELVRGLPRDFPAPICVVLHISPQSPSLLDAILTRAGELQAVNPRDREKLQPGRIYVAPPDYHLLVEPGIVRVTKGPRENRFRPAIDPLFRSAAQVYGPGAIGVVLSGNLDDGTAGLWAIKQLGGRAVVQSPDDALFPAMPQSALAHVRVDYALPVAEMPALLTRLTTEIVAEAADSGVAPEVEVEVKIAKEENPLDSGLGGIAEPSVYACPECHGVLLQLKEGNRVRFRCHTGHAYSTEALLAEIGEAIEQALWNAIRAFEEGELLMRRMGEHVKAHGDGDARILVGRADEAKRQADALRAIVSARGSGDAAAVTR
jgi:two-component system, chemotaxis family, protein-glutamate methylesterase/glutaminase